jgi:hypothetical protein
MSQLPDNLSRIGDELEAAAEREIAARTERRAAIRRGIVVALVAVTPAVLVMPEALAPLHPTPIESLAPSGEIVDHELGADEAHVAARVRVSSRARPARPRRAGAAARTARPASRPSPPWGVQRARL